MEKLRMKVIFIDIDNTLLDFDEYVRVSMRTGFEKYGLRSYEAWMYDVFKRENDKLWHDIELGKLTFSEFEKIRWKRVFEALNIVCDGMSFERYFRAELHESAIAVPGAMEMLEALSSKYILCAASNGPYEQQMHRLKLAGMNRFFSYFFISEKIGVSKPGKQFFEKAFAELNEGRDEKIKPEESVIIGDSLTSDIKGGIDSGMKTCWYKRKAAKAASEDELAKIDITAEKLEEIAGLIEKNQGE